MTKSLNQPDWLNLINIENVNSAEIQRRAFTFFTMILVAVVLITVLVFLNYQYYDLVLTIMMLLSDITLLLCAFYFIKTGKLTGVALIVMSIICVLCLALAYTGGKDNTALYWLMFYPIVAFSTLGFRLGLVVVSILLVFTVLLLFGPNIGQVDYKYAEDIRFTLAFSLVFLFSLIGEYFRNKSHLAIAQMTLLQKQDAHTDQLTGLANRRFITNHYLPLVKSRPEQYLPLSVLLVDLDHFKAINDMYGHGVGDQVLIEFSQMLENQLRASDIKVRYGGEEFMIVLPQIGLIAAQRVADKLRNHIELNPIVFTEFQINITCSIGVAQVSQIHEFNEAVKVADDHLYDAKSAGRNCVVSSLSKECNEQQS
ncbi:GGDEF domain-containing protein [Pseudoalteromonas sp. A601]|uniref:GGDEF domain-containing protein n=1 Tax=Pseudoalteromonas sp. A601 TaxID=1967839 RepID=UPI000B3C379F|nr:GGDEF domain-containing protein [Pseudoalteromonas sp. A601]OUS73608.1 GGDEF domain-containing protein [Pseudoalteromonas sp. A601]